MTQAIVGTWYFAGDRVAFTFLASGLFLVADKGTGADASGQSGLEYGSYTWNELTGALTLAFSVNTDGEWGMSHAGITSATVANDSLTLNGAEGPFSIPRLISPANSIIGSWYAATSSGGSDHVVFTFLADGTYLLADKGTVANDPNGTSGIEWGNYTWNSTTGAFTVTTVVNTDGQWGFSHPQPGEGPFFIHVNGDTLTLDGGDGLAVTRLSPLASAPVGGTAGNDSLVGTAGNDALSGLAGADTLVGNAGNDTIDGGTGNDTAGFTGNYSSYTIAFEAGTGDLIVTGADGTDRLRNVETLRFTDRSVPVQQGGAGADQLQAGDGGELLHGGGGNDQVLGGAGADALYGDEGSDTLAGAAGDDLLDGGAGADSMTGGAGNDTYIVDDAGDVVIESEITALINAGEIGLFAESIGRSADKVIASINYTLANLVEDLDMVAGTLALAGTGNALANVLSGNDGNNRLTGLAGDDSLNGGAGMDTATYNGQRSQYSVNKSGDQFIVVGSAGAASDGADALTGVERLQFADKLVALDLDGNAGQTAKLLGAVFGSEAVDDEVFVGIGIWALDSGYSYQVLMQAALNLALGAGASNGAVVDLLYTNLFGAGPSQSTHDALVGYLDNGSITAAGLGVLASNLSVNLENINFTGLIETGIEFTAFG